MNTRDVAIGFGATMLVAAPVAFFVAHEVAESPTKDTVSTPEPPAPRRSQPSSAPAPPPAPAPKSDRETLSSFSYSRALALARKKVVPVSDGNSFDGGTMVFTVWAALAMRLSDVQVAKNETSSALVKKDAQGEVGKRVCVRGSVIEIYVRRETLDDGDEYKWALGTLMAASGSLYRFHAAGSTGKLVEGSSGRFCGVVTGMVEYESMGGARMQAVKAVGMFDLPENR